MLFLVCVERVHCVLARFARFLGGFSPLRATHILDCLDGLDVLGNGGPVRFSESVAFFAGDWRGRHGELFYYSA